MSARSLAPLTPQELAEFLTGSDFGLEMAALNVIRSLGIEAEHAAVYTDPVTGKLRAYDIRARWNQALRWIRFAVECKNLSAGSPLLVHATPRLESEAYHTVVARYRVGPIAGYQPSRRENVYAMGDPVGRQTDQPAKNERGEFKSSDSATFDKWLQAVNGCLDLVREISDGPLPAPQAHAVIPILVVPEGTLWQIDYGIDGEITAQVRQVERSTLILRHKWVVQTFYGDLSYDISHLEIITLSALHQRLKNLIDDGGLLAGAEALMEEAAR